MKFILFVVLAVIILQVTNVYGGPRPQKKPLGKPSSLGPVKGKAPEQQPKPAPAQSSGQQSKPAPAQTSGQQSKPASGPRPRVPPIAPIRQ